MEKTLAQGIEELTTGQIVQLLDLSWNDYGGEAIREIAFDVIEDRHGEEYADRLYSELWHRNRKAYARATVQYRPNNPAGVSYDVKLWTIDPRGGFSYAGNGRAFADNIAADRWARGQAERVEYLAPSI